MVNFRYLPIFFIRKSFKIVSLLLNKLQSLLILLANGVILIYPILIDVFCDKYILFFL